MPLLDGKDNQTVQANFAELRNSGFSEKQAWAISLKKAGKSKTAARLKNKVTNMIKKDQG